MDAVLKRERKLPAVSFSGSADQPLKEFPNEAVINWGKQLTEKLAEEAKSTQALATEMNRHRLLVDYSLPVPQPPADFTFRDRYLAAMKSFAGGNESGNPAHHR